MTTPTEPPIAEERSTTEGPVYTVTGGDWDTLIDEEHDDRIVGTGPARKAVRKPRRQHRLEHRI